MREPSLRVREAAEEEVGAMVDEAVLRLREFIGGVPSACMLTNFARPRC